MEIQGGSQGPVATVGEGASRPRGADSSIRIGIIATYFGDWPPWFPAFLLSCAGNPTVDWLIFTDCPALPWCPPNVRTIPFSLDRLNELAGAKTGLDVRKRLYSQCDLRPAYGVIFEDYLGGFDFWGHCDLDVIWGDLRRYITDSILDRSDIVCSRQGNASGHLSLWRNDARVNRLFEEMDGWREVLGSPEYFRFDEGGVTDHLKAGKGPRVYWEDLLVVDYYHLEKHPYGWRWADGRVWDSSGSEACYLHFMTWKRYLKRIDFRVGDPVVGFVVQRRGIWSGRRPAAEVALNLLRYDRWFGLALEMKRKLEKWAFAVRGEQARRRLEATKRRRW